MSKEEKGEEEERRWKCPKLCEKVSFSFLSVWESWWEECKWCVSRTRQLHSTAQWQRCSFFGLLFGGGRGGVSEAQPRLDRRYRLDLGWAFSQRAQERESLRSAFPRLVLVVCSRSLWCRYGRELGCLRIIWSGHRESYSVVPMQSICIGQLPQRSLASREPWHALLVSSHDPESMQSRNKSKDTTAPSGQVLSKVSHGEALPSVKKENRDILNKYSGLRDFFQCRSERKGHESPGNARRLISCRARASVHRSAR